MFVGVSTALTAVRRVFHPFVREGLKLYYRFTETFSETQPDFLLDGSTSFDGSNDYIELASDGRTDFANQSFTISAWVKFDTVDADHAIFSYDFTSHSAPYNACHLRLHYSGKLFFVWNDGSSDQSLMTTSTYSANTWYHVACTFTSGSQKIYVNGSLEVSGTRTDTITYYAQEVWIGRANNGWYMDGEIANLGIWSRALSASEVESIQWRGSYSELKDTELTNLVSWYDLDSTSLGSDSLTNGTFENWASASDANNWGEYTEGSSTVARSTDSYAGTYAMSFVIDGSNSSVGIYQSGAVTAGKRYKVSFYAKSDSGTPTLGVRTAPNSGNGVASNTIHESHTLSTTYTQYTTTFDTPAGDGNLILFRTSGASKTMFIDNVVLEEVLVPDSKGSNDGSIIGSTVNSDSYSGESPFKPRIQDIATPKMAVQLADGSTSFDGSNDYIDLDAHIGDFSSQSTGTISLWFKTSSDSSSMSFISASDWGDASSNFSILCNVKKIQLNIRENGTYSIDAVGSVDYNDNKWHHLAFAVDGSGNKMYIDGSQISLTYSTGSASTQSWFNSINDLDTLSIGANKDNTTRVENYFNGSMANVAIYSSALTQSQVQELMFTEKYSGLSSDLKTNLVSWYDLGSTTLGSELVTNGGFDSNTTSWSSVDGSLASVLGGQSGNCLELTRTGAGNQYAKQTNVTLVVGKSYEFSFYVKSGTSGDEAFSCYCYDGSTVHSVAGTSTSSWVKHTKVFVMGGSDSTLNEITLSKATATAGTMLFDSVSLKEVQVEDLQASNDGSVYGATTTTGYTSSPHGVVDPLNYGEVYSGRALDFDGTNDYVSVPDDNSLSFGDGSNDSAFSISAWINMDDATDFPIVTKGTLWNTNTEYHMITTSDDKLRLMLLDNSLTVVSEYAQTSSALTSYQGQWIHVCCTYNGVGGASANAGISIYVNGVSQSLSLADNTTGGAYVAMENLGADIHIGRNNTQYGNGKINNLKIFLAELTQTQVQELYTNPETVLPTGVSSSNLKLDLPMQEGANSYVYDGSIRIGPELVVNGDMELDSNWGDVVSPAINERSTEIVRTGTYSRKIVGDSNYDGMAQSVTVVAGESYLVSGWVYGDGTNKLYARAYDSGGSGYDNFWIGSSNDGIVVPAEWTYYEKIFKAEGTSFNIQILQGDTSAGGVTFYADDISLKNVTAGQNHGTITGATWVTGQEYGYQASLVRSNTPMIFDGSDDYVNLQAPPLLDNIFDGGGTFSCWFNAKSDGENNVGAIIGKDRWSIFTKDESSGTVKVQFQRMFTAWGKWYVTGVTLNQWHHIVVTYDSSSVSNNPIMYIDGSSQTVTEDETPSGSVVSDATKDLLVGSYKTTNNYDGLVNEIAIWDKVLDADAVTALYGSGTPLNVLSDSGNYDNSDDLQGYWRNDGITTWTDRANTGVASFDGSGYLNCGNITELNGVSKITLCAWVKPDVLGQDDGFMSKGNSGNNRLFMGIKNTSGAINVGVSNGSGNHCATEDGVLSVNTWTFVVMVFDGTQSTDAEKLKVYVNNGVQKSLTFNSGSAPSTTSDISNNFNIGMEYESSARMFFGQMASSSIFNIALTASEISELYSIDKRSSISGHSQFSNCIGSWLMGAGTGDSTSTIQDQTSHNHDATVSSVSLIGYNDGTASGSPVSIVIPEGSTSGRDSQGFLLSDTTSTSNNGLRMYGGGEVIKIDDSELFHLGTKDFTFEFWAKFNETSTTRGFFNYFKDANNRFHLSNYANIDFWANVGGSDQSTQISNTRDLDWHHYVITKESNTMKIYIDSSVVKTNTSWTQDINFTGGTFYIGVRTDDGSDLTDKNVDGSIDEFKIYHKALSSSEVTKNYNNGKSAHQ